MKVSRGNAELRSTGLDVFGDTPWGTHFCNFFETKQDLLDILIPYFKAGLENNEFCLWITADPVTVEDALRALHKAVPDFDNYIQNESIEILPHYDWYLKDGALDGAGVIRGWHKMLKGALTRGYAGMRVSGNTAWLDREMWNDFLEYEREINDHIAGMPIILFCTYPLNKCNASDVLEVARAHKHAISKRVGRWEIMETPEIKKEEIRKLEEKTFQLEEREARILTDRDKAESKLLESERNLDALINCSPDPIWFIDKELRLVVANESYFEQLKKYYGVSLRVGDHILSAVLNEDRRQNWKRIYEGVLLKGERITVEYQYEGDRNPGQFCYDITINPVFNESQEVVGIGCYTQDITERKKAADLVSKSQSELAEAQKLAQYGNWNFDLVTRKITWSEELYHIFGTDKKSFLQTPDSFMNLVVEEDREMILETGLRSQKYGTPFDIEYRIIAGSGERRIIHEIGQAGRDADGNIIRLFGTAQNITAWKKAEEAKLRAEAEIKSSYQQLQDLTAHLQHIREEERTHIAREIHDELGQQLTGLKMGASWIGKKMTMEDKSVQDKLAEMVALIDETVKTVRRISSALRPGILDDLGLIAALEWQAQEFEKRTGIRSHFFSGPFDLNPEKNLSTNVFRVYQEVLTNIARHANATMVDTILEHKDDYVSLIIRDDGQGFDLNDVKGKNSLGLTGMRERALMVNGELTIERNKPKGTVVILKVPLLSGA